MNRGSIFTYEIKDASLFYQNHFIVLLHHNKLYFYRYLLQKQESGSVKPHQNNNKYKITTSYTTDAQYFTALSCINNNLSHLLLTASSDKSINIYDANVNKLILSIPNASKGKPIHSITLADYETPCSNFHDGFLTCSINDSIRWWDIRTQHNVRVFEGHSHSKYPLKCSISPCGRYISSGSEENGYYIWDVRTSNTLAKVAGGHTDAVLDVDFNPKFAELATSSIDGKVRFFTEMN
ncbi:WD40 repeat-like protein [Anaeromyces robustus]|uniref:WD40 repeat-like protein n=1 Tax=Anaeromyces robustus TaxID=1754192 RepID=A0A1Y1XNW5_9FUNG|nr:WD40 repeat-like protein [Anaeromyces robustus]|eukprot:ORX87422.1 WD40 repeat-like protein [Anaeromyces robustus]